ncbi:hypothetical protein N0V93_002457 [Gnomoniopsis smithogilvyi]|uniref:Uncharacterized protein n=1 Tax=Gnomoniopsis smithogilvyi TaxID=1191159 RepID=A0A9W8YWH9_9PEZI|nr:hypothetical protein N0V93_002457 [Gnomoniopsis smithogilvyi]
MKKKPILLCQVALLAPPLLGGSPNSVISRKELDKLFVAIKTYLEEATKAHSVSKVPHPLLNDGVYTWTVSDSDIRGLLQYILNATDRSRQQEREDVSNPSSDPSLSDECPRLSKAIQPVIVSPAMTISVPEASFTSDGRTQRRRSSTTTTIFTQDNVTEITWQAKLSRLEAAGDPRNSPVGSDVSRLSSSRDTSSNETKRGPPTPQSRSGAEHSSKAGLLTQNSSRNQQQSPMVVTTSADDTTQQAAQEVEETEGKMSYLRVFRKKSAQLGHAIGSFMNGDYRNADHKPRRESTVVRLRSALDRIEPSRVNQDPAIFGALTGAQPINVVDQYHARRPDPPSNTCSEDGR